MNINNATRTLALAVTAAATAVALAACSDPSTPNHIEVKTADTGITAKADHIAPTWLPDDARDVTVKRRTTGNERILVASYTGRLDAPGCFAIAEPGQPNAQELNRAYAADDLTKNATVADFTTRPSLSASWWPGGQEKKTRLMCDRWWVTVDGGKIYAFSPEMKMIAENPNAN